MIHTVTITMNYTGLSGNPDGSVTKTVNADLSDVKHIIENVSRGREQKTITGNLKIRDEYDDYALYLNDTSGYYVANTDYTYTMIRGGETLETSKISLIQNNIESKELTFKLYDEIYDTYQLIYSNWETDLNIYTYTGGGGASVVYNDFRLIDTKTTQQTGLTFKDQTEWEAYVDDLIESDDYWVPVYITWSLAGQIDIDWEQLYAFGTYIGSDRFPPSGIDWVYDSDIAGNPKYKRKPKNYRTDYGTLTIFDPALGSASDTYIYTEQLANITYTTAAYTLKTLVSIFCAQQFGGLTSDLSGLDDFVGENLPASHPAKPSANQDRPYKDIQMMNISDFVPTLAGDQKSVRATVSNLNFKTISDFIETLGFTWYIEDAGGTPVMKCEHYSLKILGSSNPDLSNYKGRNYLYKTREYNIQDAEFDVITNSVLGGYEFSKPEYRFFDGSKKKEFVENRIFSNLDHVIDAKESVFDLTSGNNWVACLTTVYISPYYVRYIKSDASIPSGFVNNYESCFYWLSLNNFEMPGRYSSDGDEFAEEFTSKLKQITLRGIPIENPQTDFSVYDYIDYYGIEAEILRIEMPTLAREADITIKFH